MSASTSQTDSQSRLTNRLELRLQAMRTAGLHRNPPRIDARHNAHIVVGGVPLVNFASNDYLGLGTCPEWRRSVQDCFASYAPSASSSRLVTGNLAETELLESRFAARFGYEECLFFPSGYQANSALIAGLLADADTIFYDRRIHASMAHALAALSTGEGQQQLSAYAHGDLAALQRKLQRKQPNLASTTEYADTSVQPASSPVSAILTESLFSMDGDCLHMPSLRRIADAHNAFVIVDEAHATGVLGPAGLGLASHTAAQKATPPENTAARGADIVVGTLGKALGLFGAFALMPAGFKEYLSNFAAPVIYSTAMPPAFAACALAVLNRIEGMDKERAHLASLSAMLREQLAALPFAVHGSAHILAVETGSEDRASRMANALRARGYLVFAARHPTVPAGKAILRISLTAAHTEKDILGLAQTLRRITKETDR